MAKYIFACYCITEGENKGTLLSDFLPGNSIHSVGYRR